MGVIEFYKVIFKACFCQAFKGYSCSIDTEMRSAGMGRNTFGVDGESAIFFAYLIFLELRPGKCGFQFFLQTVLIGNNGCTGVTHCIGYKTAVHGDDPGVF